MTSEPDQAKLSWRRRFWQWRPAPYRSRGDRLSAEAQGEAAKYWMRGGR